MTQLGDKIKQTFRGIEAAKNGSTSVEHNAVKVHFNDEGQDLLWFVIDLKTTQVVDAGPFHKSVYEGKYVFLPKYLYKGERVHYSATPIVALHQPLETIKYRIVKIEKITI